MKFKTKILDKSVQDSGRDKVIIAGEAYEAPEVTTFICNYCNRDLIKLSDSSGKNVSWYCSKCSIPFEPYSIRNACLRNALMASITEQERWY